MAQASFTMTITLRAAADDDEAFLLEVYASARADEMALVPWSVEQKAAFLQSQFNQQHTFYHEQFPDASYDLILEDDQPIGRLYVRREERDIRILDVTLLPQHRNRGVGTLLIRKLLTAGAETSKPVTIWLEDFNPSMRLFERLGFSKIQGDGVNCLMEWRAEK